MQHHYGWFGMVKNRKICLPLPRDLRHRHRESISSLILILIVQLAQMSRIAISIVSFSRELETLIERVGLTIELSATIQIMGFELFLSTFLHSAFQNRKILGQAHLPPNKTCIFLSGPICRKWKIQQCMQNFRPQPLGYLLP